CSDVEEAGGAEEGRARLSSRGREQAERRSPRLRRRARDAPGEAVRDVTLVAGERLVAAVAGQRNGYVAACLLCDQERRKRGLVAEWLVIGGREPRQRRGDVLLDLELFVNRPVSLGNDACVRALVVARIREA